MRGVLGHHAGWLWPAGVYAWDLEPRGYLRCLHLVVLRRRLRVAGLGAERDASGPRARGAHASSAISSSSHVAAGARLGVVLLLLHHLVLLEPHLSTDVDSTWHRPTGIAVERVCPSRRLLSRESPPASLGPAGPSTSESRRPAGKACTS